MDKNIVCASIYRANLQRTGFYSTKGVVGNFFTIKWKLKTGKYLSNEASNDSEYVSWIRSTPIIYGRVIYFGASDGYLYAVDIDTGKEIWKFQTGNCFDNTPVIGEETIYAINRSNGYLYSINLKTGKENWKLKVYGSQSTPAYANGVLYFGSDSIEEGDWLRSLLSIDVNNKKVKWRFKTEKAIFCSPTIFDGIIYFGRQGFEYSEFFAVEVSTGHKKWSIEIPENNGATIVATPIVNDGIVYFKSRNGNLYAVEASSGKHRWALQGNFSDNSSPIVNKGIIYACGGIPSGRGMICAIDAKSGQEIWEFEMCKEGYDGNHVSPIATDGIVYCAGNKNIYALDMKTGKEKWKFVSENSVESLTINDGVLYFGVYGGYLCALAEDDVSYED